MNYRKTLASAFALTVIGLQAACADNAPKVLADPEKINACIQEAGNSADIPQPEIQTGESIIRRFTASDSMSAFIKVDKNSFAANDPSRKTDEVNFFVNYTDSGTNGPIEIYRAKQISFDNSSFYPYTPNETGKAMYAHRNEIETGRNFTPTAQEKAVEHWVYETIEAMDKNFKRCMGFDTNKEPITIPDFPEL